MPGLIDSAVGGAGMPNTGLLASPAGKYGFLDALNLKRIDTPGESPEGYIAETWAAGSPGYQSPTRYVPRPQGIPIDQHGVQVFEPTKFSEDDLAGEALHLDPVAAKYRDAFEKSVTPQQLEEIKQQPDYLAPNTDVAAQMRSGIDATMRGYLVGQWPAADVQRFFTPKQKEMLDKLKTYMQSGREKP